MRETRADTRTALLQALGLHGLLFALLFAGLRWPQEEAVVAAQGDPIEAELATISDLSASMQRALQRTPQEQRHAPEPPPEPLPQPLAEDVPPPSPALPPPVPEPAPNEQEKVQPNADSPMVAKLPREQEEQHRQPDQAELNAKKQQARERQKQEQLDEIHKLREQATRERNQAEQHAQQLADARNPAAAPAPVTPGNRGMDAGLLAKYAAALQQAIRSQWTRPESVPLGQRCRISIRQLPGGKVASVEISPACPYDAPGRQSVERAVLKASPLPYAGFETVFNRTIDLNFVPEDR